MFSTYATAGAISLAAGFAIINSVLPEKRFLTVYAMEVKGSTVTATRQINVDYVVADWRVTVVSEESDAPICATIPGQGLHEGWSPYRRSEKKERDFTVDVWVGDPGCYGRLKQGKHKMFVTWTPRDGSPPVTHKTQFTKL